MIFWLDLFAVTHQWHLQVCRCVQSEQWWWCIQKRQGKEWLNLFWYKLNQEQWVMVLEFQSVFAQDSQYKRVRIKHFIKMTAQQQKLSTQKYACFKLQCHRIFLLLNGEVGKLCNAAAGCCHTTRMESGLCIFYVPSFAITAATSTLLIWIHSLTVILVTCTNHWHFLFFSFLERQVINLSSDDIPCPAGKQW